MITVILVLGTRLEANRICLRVNELRIYFGKLRSN